MALKIIGVGFGRTGTLSCYVALNELGYNCYHMKEVLEIKNKKNKHHLDFWLKVAEAPTGQQHNWEEVFANYDATVDNPGCCVWRELWATYPNAKILLTVHPRGEEAWYNSTMETIYASERMWESKVLAFFIPRLRKSFRMFSKLIWQKSQQGTMADKASAIAYYQQHIKTIKTEVPSDKLLVFSVSDGWKPLCDFLNKPVPNIPFPRVNEKATMKKNIRGAAMLAYGLLTISTVLILGLLYGLWSVIA